MADAKKDTAKKAAKEKEPKISAPDKPKLEKVASRVEENDIKTAKAGKRSIKAIKEVEERQAKEARKVDSNDTEKSSAIKPAQKPPRPRIERAGKNYRKVAQLVDNSKTYALTDAIELVVKTNPVKFDASVELHVNLGVDPKQADQNVRDIVVLPAGTGKTVRIAVFADGEAAKQATDAKADIVGSDELLQKLDKGLIEFDVLISLPTLMPKLGKYAKLLGPKGLMPNPKSGTVTTDVAKAVTEAKAGRVEYRVDSAGIIHVAVGKVSFGSEKLKQNMNAIIKSIKAAKPASLKGVYIRSAYISTTMGPSIKTDIIG
jgi:large subunit ribosomal protein L1